MRKVAIPIKLSTLKQDLPKAISSFKETGVDRVFICGVGNAYLETCTAYTETEFMKFAIDTLKSEIILLNNGTHNQVETMAINAKQKLHEAGIENINSTVIPEITFSQGYVTIYPTRIYTSEELLQYADKALYHVKENGRNDYLILEEEE